MKKNNINDDFEMESDFRGKSRNINGGRSSGGKTRRDNDDYEGMLEDMFDEEPDEAVEKVPHRRRPSAGINADYSDNPEEEAGEGDFDEFGFGDDDFDKEFAYQTNSMAKKLIIAASIFSIIFITVMICVIKFTGKIEQSVKEEKTTNNTTYTTTKKNTVEIKETENGTVASLNVTLIPGYTDPELAGESLYSSSYGGNDGSENNNTSSGEGSAYHYTYVTATPTPNTGSSYVAPTNTPDPANNDVTAAVTEEPTIVPDLTATTAPVAISTPAVTSIPAATVTPAPTDLSVATSTPTPEPVAISTPTPEPVATSTPTPEPVATSTPTPEPVAPEETPEEPGEG